MDPTGTTVPPAGKAVTLTAQIELVGPVNPAVRLTPELASALKAGWRRPLPVTVRINGEPGRLWHTNLMPLGDGGFLLYLHGRMRKQSRTAVGDIVNVELWFDEVYAGGPQHPVPTWFDEALADNPAAAASWDRLPPSRRKELLRYFAGLRSTDAIERNVARAIHVLAGNPGHYMGRDWADGR